MTQRIDKFLWYARFFKSRTLAATAVADGRVRINGERCAKPAAPVKPGDVLTFPAGPRVRVIRVCEPGVRRGPATEARTLYEDLSPPAPSPGAPQASVPLRERGAGRPTKKERRAIDALDGDA